MGSKHTADVIVIGGSYAGLSAALALGRSRRRVIVIDAGKPCNATTPHSHNFLTRDGISPKELTAIAKEELRQYPTVRFINGLAETILNNNGKFEVGLASGEMIDSSKVILATGIIDKLPAIEGIQACWGISVIHCPYCHGYEFRDRPTGILGSGERAFHLATVISNLTSQLKIYTNGENNFTKEQLGLLEKHRISVMEEKVARVNHTHGLLSEIVLLNGMVEAIDAIYAIPPLQQHSNFAAMLGCESDDGGYIKIDNLQQTTVAGVFACGDNSSRMRSIASAVYTGSVAGAAANAFLANEWK